MKDQESLWNKFYRERLEWKKETLGLPKLLKGKIVLELGVGTGKTLKSILKQNPKKVVALDFSEEALQACKNSTNDSRVSFVNSDILNFQSEEKFDIIVCYYLLNNLNEEERKAVVEKMQELLDDRGIILFEDFAKGDFREKQKRKDNLWCHFFTKSEVKELFSNFSDVKIKIRGSSPIRTEKTLKRVIISAVSSKSELPN